LKNGVGGAADLRAGGRRRADQQCGEAGPPPGGATVEGQFRLGQWGGKSACRIIADAGSIVPPAGPAAVGVPGGRGRGGAAGGSPPSLLTPGQGRWTLTISPAATVTGWLRFAT